MTLERSSPSSTRAALALLAILAVALFLRVFHLGHESLWLDEGFSARVARLPLPELLRSAAGDIHPPLYYLLLHFWIGVFGASETALRLPSALFGVASVVLVERIGRRLFGRPASLVASGLLALSTFAIHYSQEARSYALLGLLTLASMDAYAALAAARGSAGRGALAASLRYALVSIALVYTHNFAWLALLAQNLHFAWGAWREPAERRRKLVRWALLQAAVCVAFLPWLAVLVGQLRHVGGGLWVPRPTAASLVKTAWEFAGSAPLLVVEGVLAAISLLGLGARGSRVPAGAARERPSVEAEGSLPRARGLVALWIACGVLVPFAVSFLVAPVYLTRTLIGAAFALFLWAADGICRLPGRRALLTGLAILGILPLPAYYSGTHKDPWREVVSEVEHAANHGDLVVIHAGYNKANAWDYYARRTDLEVLAFPIGGGAVEPASVVPLAREAVARAHVWVVLSRGDDPQALIRSTLIRSHRLGSERIYTVVAYEPSRSREIPSIEVSRYDR